MDNLIEESIKAREKLQNLINLTNSGSISAVGDYIESLTESECRWILKMISYGSWKDFRNESNHEDSEFSPEETKELSKKK